MRWHTTTTKNNNTRKEMKGAEREREREREWERSERYKRYKKKKINKYIFFAYSVTVRILQNLSKPTQMNWTEKLDITSKKKKVKMNNFYIIKFIFHNDKNSLYIHLIFGCYLVSLRRFKSFYKFNDKNVILLFIV